MAKKDMNQMDITKEFQQLSVEAAKLAQTGNYDVDMLILGLKHQLKESNFLYGTLMKANKQFYDMKTEPQEHQLVYVQLGRGYGKEIYDPHWCYVLRHCGSNLMVLPVTSVKPTSSAPFAPYEFDIEEEGGVIGRVHLDDIRSIDKMRIEERRGYRNVVTPRAEIEKAFSSVMKF